MRPSIWRHSGRSPCARSQWPGQSSAHSRPRTERHLFPPERDRAACQAPVGERLLVEARISPKDIAFIKVGDKANVKITAYDFSIYGGLSGRVRNISADSIYDEVEKQAYFSALVETDHSYLTKNGHRLPIMPGMISDVEILTGSKSLLTYLFKPVLRAFNEALTER